MDLRISGSYPWLSPGGEGRRVKSMLNRIRASVPHLSRRCLTTPSSLVLGLNSLVFDSFPCRLLISICDLIFFYFFSLLLGRLIGAWLGRKISKGQHVSEGELIRSCLSMRGKKLVRSFLSSPILLKKQSSVVGCI